MATRDIRKERIMYLGTVRRYAKESMANIGKVKVLDAGCGNGAFLRAIKSVHKGINAIGVDKDGACINFAIRKETANPKGIKYAVCQIENLPFNTASFDMVIIALVLHEVDIATRKQMLKEANRVLKRGGKLMVIDGVNEKKSILDVMKSNSMKEIAVNKFNGYDNAYTARKG